MFTLCVPLSSAARKLEAEHRAVQRRVSLSTGGSRKPIQVEGLNRALSVSLELRLA